MDNQTGGGGAEGVCEPYVLAMVVCDSIYQCPSTRKKSLLGTFTAYSSSSFPTRIPQMCVYVAMTDGRGKVPINIRFVDAEEKNEPIAVVDAEAEFKDPIMVLEMIMGLGNLEVPVPGEYRLQLYSGSTPLMERRLLMIQTGNNSEEQHE